MRRCKEERVPLQEMVAIAETIHREQPDLAIRYAKTVEKLLDAPEYKEDGKEARKKLYYTLTLFYLNQCKNSPFLKFQSAIR